MRISTQLKEEFEKDILEVLDKYGLKEEKMQKVIIKCEVNKNPIIRKTVLV